MINEMATYNPVLTDLTCVCSVCGEIGAAPNERWWYVGDSDETVCNDCRGRVEEPA